MTSDQEFEQCEEEHLKRGLNKGKVPKVGTRSACIEELQETEDVGEIIAKSIKQFFDDEDNRAFIQKLKDNGVQFELHEKAAASSNVLEGKTIVISGTFRDHSRDEMKDLIEANGGKNVSGVSKSTTYLLAGEGIGPSKLEKAQTFGVQIISEDEFYAMINQQPSTDDENKPSEKENPPSGNQQLSLF